MANPTLNCSISKQDCGKYNTPDYFPDVPFTSSSCVAYEPWYTGDSGVCGWVGAPCTTSTANRCNCNVHIDVCVNGRCGFGLGDHCGGDQRFFCNGDIMCGTDNRCGGKNAWIQIAGKVLGNEPVTPDIAKQRCIAGIVHHRPQGGYICADPADPHGKKARVRKIVGGTVGGLAVLSAAIFFLFYLKKRRKGMNHPPTPVASYGGPPPVSNIMPQQAGMPANGPNMPDSGKLQTTAVEHANYPATSLPQMTSYVGPPAMIPTSTQQPTNTMTNYVGSTLPIVTPLQPPLTSTAPLSTAPTQSSTTNTQPPANTTADYAGPSTSLQPPSKPLSTASQPLTAISKTNTEPSDTIPTNTQLPSTNTQPPTNTPPPNTPQPDPDWRTEIAALRTQVEQLQAREQPASPTSRREDVPPPPYTT